MDWLADLKTGRLSDQALVQRWLSTSPPDDAPSVLASSGLPLQSIGRILDELAEKAEDPKDLMLSLGVALEGLDIRHHPDDPDSDEEDEGARLSYETVAVFTSSLSTALVRVASTPSTLAPYLASYGQALIFPLARLSSSHQPPSTPFADLILSRVGSTLVTCVDRSPSTFPLARTIYLVLCGYLLAPTETFSAERFAKEQWPLLTRPFLPVEPRHEPPDEALAAWQQKVLDPPDETLSQLLDTPSNVLASFPSISKLGLHPPDLSLRLSLGGVTLLADVASSSLPSPPLVLHPSNLHVLRAMMDLSLQASVPLSPSPPIFLLLSASLPPSQSPILISALVSHLATLSTHSTTTPLLRFCCVQATRRLLATCLDEDDDGEEKVLALEPLLSSTSPAIRTFCLSELRHLLSCPSSPSSISPTAMKDSLAEHLLDPMTLDDFDDDDDGGEEWQDAVLAGSAEWVERLNLVFLILSRDDMDDPASLKNHPLMPAFKSRVVHRLQQLLSTRSSSAREETVESATRIAALTTALDRFSESVSSSSAPQQ